MAGTNFEVNENELYELIQGLLNVLEKNLQGKDTEEYRKMIENLGKYVGDGGSLSYAVINPKFTKTIEEMLKHEKIDYMLMPTDNGTMGIAVKDKDKARFFEIQETVLSMSTEYYKELTNPDNFLDYCKTNPYTKNLEIPVFSFSNNETRLLVQEALYQNNVLPCYDDRNQKVYIQPDKLFSKNGDYIDSLFMSGLELSKCTMYSEYKQIKIAQLTYDRDTLNNFIDLAKNGNTCYLVDINNNSKSELNIDNDGNIVLNKDGRSNILIDKETIANSDRTALFAQLSKYTDNIRDMVICNNYQYRTLKFSISESEKKEVYSKLMEHGRPIHTDNTSKAISAMGKDFEGVLKSIIQQANEEILSLPKYKYMTQKQLANYKKGYIIDILARGNNSDLLTFYNTEYKINENNILNLEAKKAFINNILSSIDNVLGNTAMDMKVEMINRKKLEEELSKGTNFNKDTEKEQFQEQD